MVCSVLFGVYCTVWCVLYCMVCTALYGVYCTVWYVVYCLVCTVLYGVYCTVLYGVYCTVLYGVYCTVWYVVYCTVWCVLYCTVWCVLYCTVCIIFCSLLHQHPHNTYRIINSFNGADFLKVPVWVGGVLDGISLTVGGIKVEEELGIDILWAQSQIVPYNHRHPVGTVTGSTRQS